MFGEKFSLGGIMKGAKKMQEMMEETEKKLAKVEVTGESGAGAVKVTMTGRQVVINVEIEPELLKEEKNILEELLAGAMNDALQKTSELSKSTMMDAGKLLSGLAGDKDKAE